MININFFNTLLVKYSQYNSRRHELIKRSSDALRLSKQAIFALHRNEASQSLEFLTQAEKIFSELEEFFKNDAELKGEGSYLAALEEYVEAKLFYGCLKGEAVDDLKVPFSIGYDEYLSGICDLTGELTRSAVLLATQGKTEKVKEIRKMVDDIISEIIKFDLVGKLRVKFDDAKRNLKRLEEIAYDLEIRSRG